MALLLSRADLERVLGMDAVIDTVEGAFAAYSAGKTVTPLRVAVSPQGANGVLLAMPCGVAEPPALGTKVVSVFRDNPSRGLPTVTSIYLLSGYETGEPLAAMDGGHLTAVRTAAGSAVATRHLAQPEAHTLGVFGTGVQARFHVLALCRVRRVQEVLVAGTSREKEEQFAERLGAESGAPVRPASPEEASAADVVAACTTSATPVVLSQAVRAGVHVNAVGAFTPQTRELPTALIERAAVYVDARAGAFAEAGDLLIPVQEGGFSLDAVRGEIGEVVLGRVPGRHDDQEVTVYKSVGAAFLDAATARLAYERAVQARIGTRFDFS